MFITLILVFLLISIGSYFLITNLTSLYGNDGERGLLGNRYQTMKVSNDFDTAVAYQTFVDE